ncbi:MAG: ATP-binding protein [Methanobacteriota archaeon]
MKPLLLLFCETFRSEVQNILSKKKYPEVYAHFYPHVCSQGISSHQRILSVLNGLIQDYDQIILFGGSPINSLSLPSRVRRVITGSCYELIAPSELVRSLVHDGAFLTTPGWICSWMHYVRELGFDPQEHTRFFNTGSDKIVLLDTGVYPDISVHLVEFSEFAGMPYSSIRTGTDLLELYIRDEVMQWQHQQQENLSLEEVRQAREEASNHAMLLSLMTDISLMTREDEVIKKFMHIFSLIFDPRVIRYLPFSHAGRGELHVKGSPSGTNDENQTIQRLEGYASRTHGITETGKGFFLSFNSRNTRIGVAEVEDVSFPVHLNEYLNTALSISGIFGLTIVNARIYEDLTITNMNLAALNEDLKQKETDLEYFSKELQNQNDELTAVQQKFSDLNNELEERVRARTVEVEDLLTQKDQFIDIIGHDLKTPLTPLCALLPYVYKKVDDPHIKEILSILIKDASYIRDHIEKILTLVQVSRESPSTDPVNIDLKTGLEAVISNHGYSIHEKGISIHSHIPDGLIVHIDPFHFKAIITNLIENALKYTPAHGEITIAASTNDEYLTITFTDTGIGMTSDEILHIFDDFYRADSSRHERDSHGLGLSIVKRIVRTYHGRIQAQSQGKDKGSTFTVILPDTPLPSADN